MHTIIVKRQNGEILFREDRDDDKALPAHINDLHNWNKLKLGHLKRPKDRDGGAYCTSVDHEKGLTEVIVPDDYAP